MLVYWNALLLFALVSQLCDAVPRDRHSIHKGPSKFFSKGRKVQAPFAKPPKSGLKQSKGKSLMEHEEVEELIGEMLCADPDHFNGDTYIYAYCHNIHDEETCESIPGFYWEAYWHECHSHGSVSAEAAQKCEDLEGELHGNTCYEEGTYVLHILDDHDFNISVPFDGQTCIDIHQAYEDDAWYFFWELPVMCCEHEISSCERDQLICEDPDSFTRDGLIYGSCYDVDQDNCSNSEHFVWEYESMCITRWEAPMTEEEAKEECVALGGFFDSYDAFTCGDFNTMLSLVLNTVGMPHGPLSDEDGSCGTFFDAVADFFGDENEAREFFNSLFPYKCCGGGDAVCMWESYSECNDIVVDYEPPAGLASCPSDHNVWEWDECNMECRVTIEQMGNDLGCCAATWMEFYNPLITFGRGEDALHHVLNVCGIEPLHDPLVGCPGRHGGPCPFCEEIHYFMNESDIELEGPVCGIDGVNYEDECAAQFCGETFVACYHECPCEEPHDPSGCTDVDLPNFGHQGGPQSAYDVIHDVDFPEECCDLCENDPNCTGFTWTGIVFALFGTNTSTSDCYLFEEVNNGEGYCPFCWSGNKLPDNFYHDETLADYWQGAFDDSGLGLDYSDFGYSTDDHTWYHDGLATCIGWGYYDDACDNEKLVCAGGDTYGYGADQIALLHELLEDAEHADEEMPHTRHYLCPECNNEPWDDGYMFVCYGEKYIEEMPKEVVEMNPDEYLIPGKTYPERAWFVDCYCGYHHIGEHVADDPYWGPIAAAHGIGVEMLSHYEGVWYYKEVPTCVGMGRLGDSCDNTQLYCAGGDQFGAADKQMEAIQDALDNYGVHPECD